MGRRMHARLLVALAAVVLAGGAKLPAQEVVDRIVARVESDVILLSQVRELSRYQKLVDGQSESDDQILDRLVDQWIVRTEAATARFPLPSAAEIDRNVERLRKSFASDAEFQARKRESGLSDAEVRELVEAQLYLSNYLNSRFRPMVQVDPQEIAKFYQEGLVPRAKARGQEPPTLEAAREAIQEALLQRGINIQADQWIRESRSRLHVDKLLAAMPEGAK
jgi:parvulin-like peptidyl-prolyl isomerase